MMEFRKGTNSHFRHTFESISEKAKAGDLHGVDVLEHLNSAGIEGDPELWALMLRAMGYGIDHEGRLVDLYFRQNL